MNLMSGVRSKQVATDRLRVHYLESGPPNGTPVVLVHGNLSTARFYEHVMSGAPDRYRLLAPDMRGFGDTERLPIDATRGLADWADDTHALVMALGIQEPPHLVGWSTGGPPSRSTPGTGRSPRSPSSTRSRPTGTGASSPTAAPASPTSRAPAVEPAAPSSPSASPTATAPPTRRSHPATSSTPRTGDPTIGSRRIARTSWWRRC